MFYTDEELNEIQHCLTEDRLERTLSVINNRSEYVTVIAENFYNAGNVSAVVRSIEALGFSDIHILEYENRFHKNTKISKGSEKWIKTHRYRETEECFEALKKDGYRVYYADPAPENPDIFTLPLDKPVAILFGQELPGVSEKAKSLADGGFRLPIHGFVESYNVSVSAALTLFTLRHRLESENIDFKISDEQKKELFAKWTERIKRR